MVGSFIKELFEDSKDNENLIKGMVTDMILLPSD